MSTSTKAYAVLEYTDYRKEQEVKIKGVYVDSNEAIERAKSLSIPEEEHDEGVKYHQLYTTRSLYDRKHACHGYTRVAVIMTDLFLS